MDFHLTREQEMVRKMYREFAENEVKPLAEELDEEERFPMETVEKMGDVYKRQPQGRDCMSPEELRSRQTSLGPAV